jgi:hypothetical protein
MITKDKTMKKIDNIIKEKAIVDYLGGMSYREVGKKYKVDHKTVQSWVKKSGGISRTKEDAFLLMSHKTKGVRRSPNTEFKKGVIVWNKGSIGIMKPNKTSFQKGKHYSPNTEFKKGENTEENNPRWLGDSIGYYGLHFWLVKKRGKAKVCQHCGSTVNVQWANKSFEYKRDIDDWLELCSKCHHKYDRENGWGIATKKFGLNKKQ